MGTDMNAYTEEEMMKIHGAQRENICMLSAPPSPAAMLYWMRYLRFERETRMINVMVSQGQNESI